MFSSSPYSQIIKLWKNQLKRLAPHSLAGDLITQQIKWSPQGYLSRRGNEKLTEKVGWKKGQNGGICTQAIFVLEEMDRTECNKAWKTVFDRVINGTDLPCQGDWALTRPTTKITLAPSKCRHLNACRRRSNNQQIPRGDLSRNLQEILFSLFLFLSYLPIQLAGKEERHKRQIRRGIAVLGADFVPSLPQVPQAHLALGGQKVCNKLDTQLYC